MKYLSHYTREAHSALIKETGCFFAFSNEQYEAKAKKGVQYVSIGGGTFCPKSTTKEFIEGLSKTTKAAIDRDIEENGAEKIISREYFNYESQITMDTTDALEGLRGHIERRPDLFTEALIKKTFAESWNYAIENDLF